MIFPFLRGFLGPRHAPATWALLAINLFVFIGELPSYERAQARLEALLEDPAFMGAQGQLFAQMIEREPQLFPGESLGAMQARVKKGDVEARSLLGALAMRNPQFVAHAEAYDFGGDEVAIASWREAFRQVRAIQAEHPSYRWGLSHLNASPQNWVSYQFAHSGFMHLATNMAFLLIFASFLEARIGSALVVLGYLLSGLAGAFAFTRLTGLTASPLVGASASVSGLGALTGFYLWKEKVPFFYLIFPQPGYMGFTALPAWAILALFALPDLGGYLASVPDVSSVAYSAHLGGAACGGAMALALRAGLLASDPYDPEQGWQWFEG